MKTKIYILIFYFFAITLLPSVRALRLQYGSKLEQKCNHEETCEMGKLVADLNFSAVQFVKEMTIVPKEYFVSEYSQEQQQFFYVLFVKSPLENSIWRPPKNAL
ncbi:hypothetical protein [Flavobacterium sp. U410]